MSVETLRVDVSDPRGPEATELISALSAELARRYDFTEDGSGGFKPEDALGPRGAFVIGRTSGRPVACGAIRPLEEKVAEVKRVFVRAHFRRRGFARAIMSELERLARERGYLIVRLETGIRQPEAISLYEELGYHRIENYGDHVNSQMSVCYEKRLV